MSSSKVGSTDATVHGSDVELEKAQARTLSPPNEPQAKPDMPPEEGTAGWLCAAGCTIGLFCTFGFLNAVGVFQTTYQATMLSTYTPSTISWIFTIQLSLMWILGPIFGRFVDTYGPPPVLVPCSILCVFSLCMLSLSDQYYQIFLSQGLGFGLGAGGIFTTTIVVGGQWFVKRRGLALGIITCGSSLGGVIFPFFVDLVIADVGFAGAMRYTALFIGILLAVACFLIKARLPKKEWNPNLKWFDFSLLINKSFGLYTLGAFLVMWGLWAPFDYISSYALSTGGFTPSLAIYLISIINATSVPGRIIPGYLGDKLGYFNVMTVVSVLTGISVFCLWIPFNNHPSHAGVILFALVFGFVSGAYVSMMMPCAAKSGSLETLGQRFGTFQSIIAFAALTGLPIQGVILTAQNGSYLGLQIFSGVSMVLGGLVIGVARSFIASEHGSARV
ncbi:hypothetical protein MMC17_008069 [Xylographa soralifera]|nr:hypothetical protein [Xylographa soralifera]